jgi:hypothetical protein
MNKIYLSLILVLALTTSSFGAWKKQGSGTDYSTNTSPAAGDAFLFWDAGTNATQNLYYSTLLSSMMGSPGAIGAVTPGAGTFASLTVNGAATWLDNVRITFNPGATVAGINVGAVASDPSTLVNGDLWYESTTNALKARVNGATVSVGSGNALTANPLSQFAATTSAQFAGVISNETGTGLVVLNDSPTLVTPNLGFPSYLLGTNITGTATGLTAGSSNALKTATSSVSVLAATSPTVGQALIATSSTTAIWQNPVSIATDSLWDAAGDLALGTGANTAARLPRGTALQILRVNASGTTLEWGPPDPGGDAILGSPAVFTELTATDFLQVNGNATISDISLGTVINYTDNIKQTFNPGSTFAGLNAGSFSGNPSTLANGDIWYNSVTGAIMGRANGASVNISALGDALIANPLSQFAATTSAQLAGVISNETGTGLVVLNDSPTLINPNLGTPSTLVGTNISGTANGFTAGVSNGLRSATTNVTVSGSAAPSAGKVLTATSSTAATWQTLSTQAGIHGTPSTTNPLAPTWSSANYVIWYGATGEIDLPTAVDYLGRRLTVYNTGAFTVTLDPNLSELIVRDGTVQGGGVSFTLSSGAGNYVELISDGVRWVTLGFKGTLTAGS